MSEVRVGEWSGVENRKHRRAPLHAAIECRRDQSVMHAHCENISINGLLVRCADPFPQDSEIIISFQLPGAQHPVRSQARVAHMVPAVFMGVEFINLSQESRDEIERYVGAHAPVAKARP
jgi:c-di-GMP-binding flagellar brake protein YcgR